MKTTLLSHAGRNVALMAVALLMGGAGAYAQQLAKNKIEGSGQLILQRYEDQQLQRRANGGRLALAPGQQAVPERMAAIVTLEPGHDASELEAQEGVEVTYAGRTFAIVSMPLSEARQLAAMDAVRTMDFGAEARPMMDRARANAHVDEVHAGTGLDAPYTGAGVVAGIFDVGMDPNHVNFKAADGTNRVRQVYHYTGTNSQVSAYTTPDQVASFTTDRDNESHGTHTMGIMAGSYDGTMNGGGGETTPHYQGVATDADIIASCGDSYSVNILQGVINAVNYGKAQGKPVVANLSFGNNYGPRDGSDSFGQAIQELSDDAVICISAGNEGVQKMGVTAKFTSLTPTVYAFIEQKTSETYQVFQFWSDDNSPLDISFVVFSPSTKKDLVEFPCTGNSLTVRGSSNADMAKYFSSASTIRMDRGVQNQNNRYLAMATVDLTPTATSGLLIGFKIKGTKNKMMRGYAGFNDNWMFATPGLGGKYLEGRSDGTISDMACAPGAICVGSYNTKASWRALNGSTYRMDTGNPDDISDFSSFGTLCDGRTLPYVCAPGALIVSSFNKYNGDGLTDDPVLVGRVKLDGRWNHWGEMQGTSMSSPFAAGVIALWLQANPSLGTQGVKDVIAATSRKDDYVNAEPVRFGNGKIDALAGIKKVINERSAIRPAVADDSDLVVTTASDGSSVEVWLGAGQGVDARLYSLSGTAVAAASAGAGTQSVTLDTSSLAPGVYVLRVNDTLSRKIAIR